MSSVTTQRLAEIPLFSHMDDEERSELRSLMSERLFQAGQVVMRAGEEGSSFQIIERGEIEIWLTDTDGKKVVLDVLGPGKFFGELSMLTGETRSASATSEEEVVTLELDREEFFDFLRRRPEAAIDVLTELGQRLKHTDDILRTRVSRNPNAEIDEHLSLGQRVADIIAGFSGSIPFLLLNLVAVSLEAIFLSIFVLVSQNRQAAKDRVKADLDYEVDVKAEMEMTVMASRLHDMERKLHHIHSDLLEFKGESTNHNAML